MDTITINDLEVFYCVGVPDEKTGEAVKLFVVPTAGSTVTIDEVSEHCKRELTAYKVPKIVRFIDALPKSTVGKILRRELRDFHEPAR